MWLVIEKSEVLKRKGGLNFINFINIRYGVLAAN